MARKRATMREGPLAELFRKTEAAQRSQGEAADAEAASPSQSPIPVRRQRSTRPSSTSPTSRRTPRPSRRPPRPPS